MVHRDNAIELNLKLWKPEGYFLLKSKHTCRDPQKDWLQYIYVIIVIRESKANIIADVKTGINKGIGTKVVSFSRHAEKMSRTYSIAGYETFFPLKSKRSD